MKLRWNKYAKIFCIQVLYIETQIDRQKEERKIARQTMK